MLTFLLLLLLVVGGVVAYRYRVPLIAKITGQKESRIRRALDQRKRS
jgi:predicted MFS family arabinose efflux permease